MILAEEEEEGEGTLRYGGVPRGLVGMKKGSLYSPGIVS